MQIARNRLENSIEMVYLVLRKIPRKQPLGIEGGAEMGAALAEGRVGVDYQFGIGVPQDSAKAAYGYRKAVEQLHKEADQGNVAGQLNLGESYEWGSYGLARNKAEALYWCQKAAQQKSRIENFAEQCVARV